MSFNVGLTDCFSLIHDQIALPSSPSWLEILDIVEADVRDVCRRILSIYTRPKPVWSELEKQVEDLRRSYKQQMEQKVQQQQQQQQHKSSQSADSGSRKD